MLGQQLLNIFLDLETTATQPQNGEIIAIGLIATDEQYNVLGEFEEYCNLGTDRYRTDIYGKTQDLWPDPVGGHDKSKWNATDIHGITWDKAKSFQTPIEMYRKLWAFLKALPDDKWKLIFHSQTDFDRKWLFYRANIWAPPLYQYLVSKTYYYEPLEDGECSHSTRYDDTMAMARKYIKNSSDGLKTAEKAQQIISKNRKYLDRTGKSPASTAQIKKWNDAIAKAETDMILSEDTGVKLEGYSLDKITRSLGLEHTHHSAISDAKVLIPIHKFLSEQL